MKTLIILCSAAIVLSGCVVSPLYGDGRDRARSHERRDRDENREHGDRDRDHDRDRDEHRGDLYRN